MEMKTIIIPEGVRSMAKVIVDLHQLKGDRRFKKWAKILTGVNREKSNGYCFEGDFIDLGRKHELEVGTLILFYHEEGSAKYHYPEVEVWTVTPNGLENLYYKRDLDRSWALDVRDEIAALIEEHKAKTQEIDRAALEAEAAAIRARLAEIEKLLSGETHG